METQTAFDTAANTEPKRARGRKDKGQETVIHEETLATRIDFLIELKTKLAVASEEYSEAVKTAAEDSGLLAAVVRKFIDARTNGKYEEAHARTKQLILCFDNIGEGAAE